MLCQEYSLEQSMVVEDQDYRLYKNQSETFELNGSDSKIEVEDESSNSTEKESVKEIYHQKQLVNKQFQIVNFDKVLFNPNESINLSHELFISNDGALRFNWAQNWISFGFQNQSAMRVEEQKNLGVINIQFERNNNFNIHPYEQALQCIKRMPGIHFNTALPILESYQFLNTYLKSVLQAISYEIQIQKDQELCIFTAFCHRFLQQYVQFKPNQMFSYSIGRLNLAMKDMQTIETGYSNEYLNLLGISHQNLSQIVMRRQKIDLQQSIIEITQQSLRGLEFMDCSKNPFGKEQYSTDIVTFDGFPIKLYQRKEILCDLFKPAKTYGMDQEYILTITEMDVDLGDLENLIQYRQRISQNQENLSLDDFLKKELSFQFEDVEYSVHSQEFINKFYTKNLDELKEQQKRIEDSKNRCKFRLINNATSSSSSTNTGIKNFNNNINN